ncbi:MAG TPA: hypothetical protein VN541_02635 [Tepidisphaeraceae bacterium]|nr:hypothetical protein [Tepidisphaeraceae bacterium]
MIDAIISGHARFLTTIDNIDEEADFSCAQAVAHLVNGEIDEDVPGYLYGYAVEATCLHVGRKLPNVCPIGSSWIEEVDAFLESTEVPVRLSDLVYGGSPVLIPEPDDYPFIGKWPATQIPDALAALKQLDLSDADPDTAELLNLMRDWLAETTKSPGVSIVGFLS